MNLLRSGKGPTVFSSFMCLEGLIGLLELNCFTVEVCVGNHGEGGSDHGGWSRWSCHNQDDQSAIQCSGSNR